MARQFPRGPDQPARHSVADKYIDMTAPSDVAIQLAAVGQPTARDLISRKLNEYNDAITGQPDNTALDVYVTDPKTGETLGGLVGRTSLGLFFIDLLYLPESLRKDGLGAASCCTRRKPRRSSAAARARCCTRSRSRRPRSTRSTATAHSAKCRASRPGPRACSWSRNSERRRPSGIAASGRPVASLREAPARRVSRASLPAR